MELSPAFSPFPGKSLDTRDEAFKIGVVSKENPASFLLSLEKLRKVFSPDITVVEISEEILEFLQGTDLLVNRSIREIPPDFKGIPQPLHGNSQGMVLPDLPGISQ